MDRPCGGFFIRLEPCGLRNSARKSAQLFGHGHTPLMALPLLPALEQVGEHLVVGTAEKMDLFPTKARAEQMALHQGEPVELFEWFKVATAV